jgi:hypothetical protein
MSNPRHIIRGFPKARIVQNLVGLSGLPAKFVLPVLLAAIGRGLSRIVRGFLLPWLVIFAISASAQTNFYVATNGSDSNPGTITQPFLTLGKAQAAEQAAGTNIKRNIYIRGGSYFNVTMELQGPQAGVGHDDSGSSWIGYPGDPPARLYGGQPLTNWIATSNGMWLAALPPYPSAALNSAVNEFTSWNVRMLLVDGAMATRAEFPTNGASLDYTNQSTQSDQSYINYSPGDIPSTMVATNAECMVDFSWNSETMQVAYITNATRTIKFNQQVGLGFAGVGLQYIPDVQTYRIYNTVEGMAHQGQFYWDKTANNVYYIPINGKDPNTSTIIVPTTDRLFLYYGYAAACDTCGSGYGPLNITFSNLTMMVNAVDVEPEGSFGYLWNHMSLFAVASGSGGSNVNFLNCTLGWCGGNAIGSDYGFVTNFNVLNSTISCCGGAGVIMRMAGPVVVSNNYIHDCGLITWQAPGVRVSTNATVIQNNLFNFHTSAIADHDVDNCRFLLNSISNCMFTDEDMGAYYQYFGPSAAPHPHGNIIQSNLFQVVGTNFNSVGTDPRNFFRPAVYLDQESSNTLIADNITLSCPTPVFVNQAGSNAAVNNVFINTNVVPGYFGLRHYISSDSSLPNSSRNNVYYTTTNFLCDNSTIWTWSNDDFWSTEGINSGLPSGATAANPALASLNAGSLTYQIGSPCPALGDVPLTFTQQALGVGNAAALSLATITWTTPAAITYGRALGAAQLNATANVAGTFSYNPATGTVLPAGTQNLSVTFTPSDTSLYSSASASVSLVVAKAPLTITASNATKVYGAPLPPLGCSYAGFVNADTTNDLTTQVWMATSSASNSPVGTYWIVGNAATSSNYALTYIAGTLAVTPVPLSISANARSMSTGSPVPPLTASYSGFVNSDTPAQLTTPVSLTTTASSNSSPGAYPITASGAVDPNYSISYVSGTLTVSPSVTPAGDLFSDDFAGTTLSPWKVEEGTWTVANGELNGSSGLDTLGYAYIGTNWTDYTVQASVRFSMTNGPWGGGIGGRLNMATGAHYAAWVYPEGSEGGSSIMNLIKWETWGNWSRIPMAQAKLPGVGTNWHTVALSFQGSSITASYDGTQEISVTDNDFSAMAPLASGGITADEYTYQTPFTFSVANVVVSPNTNASAAQVESLTLNETSTTKLTSLSSTDTKEIATRVGLKIEHLAVSPSGQANLALRGQLGQAYLLEMSIDLIHWQILATGALPSARFLFVDQTAARSDRRFYRVSTAR